MTAIKRLVLDVLKPHHPNVLELARTLAEQGRSQVRVTVVEMDDRTETLQVVIEGPDLHFDRIRAAIGGFGASLHSIDEVEVASDALQGSDC
jgi:hypothetical protein